MTLIQWLIGIPLVSLPIIFGIYLVILGGRCKACGLRGKLDPIPPEPANGPCGMIANECGWYKCRVCGLKQLKTSEVEVS